MSGANSTRRPVCGARQVIKVGQGKTRAILQIWGDESESFREYQAVAEAAEKKADLD